MLQSYLQAQTPQVRGQAHAHALAGPTWLLSVLPCRDFPDSLKELFTLEPALISPVAFRTKVDIANMDREGRAELIAVHEF